MDNMIFKRMFKRRNYELYSYIYEVTYTCIIPKIASIDPMDRDVMITPEPELEDDGYSYGTLDNSYSEYDDHVTDVVDNIFSTYDNGNAVDYGLNKKTGVKLSVYDMAKLYDEGHYVYIYNAKDLKEIYGIIESFVTYKIEHYKGPNTGFGYENDDDLFLIDQLATSMVNIYKENDEELYHYTGRKSTIRGHLTHRPSGNIEQTTVIRTDKKVTRTVSLDRLKELGID